MSFNHPLRWSYFFLCGHINMVDYINRVPSFESLSPLPPPPSLVLPAAVLSATSIQAAASARVSRLLPQQPRAFSIQMREPGWALGNEPEAEPVFDRQNYLPWIPSWVTPGSCRIEVKVNYLVFWKFILKGLFCPFLMVWGTLIPQVLK